MFSQHILLPLTEYSPSWDRKYHQGSLSLLPVQSHSIPGQTLTYSASGLLFSSCLLI